jgi:glycosyltransferase involved in cell wall biosynthesis
MFNLCEFKGLKSEYAKIPSVMYFHENQLTYPVEDDSQRDYHLAFSQFMAASVADLVLFNSSHHMNQYLNALWDWLKKMPKPSLLQDYETFKQKCEVQYPGIPVTNTKADKIKTQELKLVWSARWEQDKNPELFLDLLDVLSQKQFGYSVDLIGCSKDVVVPDLLKRGLDLSRFKTIGFVSQDKLQEIFTQADVFVSTARHEYFGISVMRAAANGCALLLPNRCVYPELYQQCFKSVAYHDDSPEMMLSLLKHFQNLKQQGTLVERELILWTKKFNMDTQAKQLDQKLERFCQ